MKRFFSYIKNYINRLSKETKIAIVLALVLCTLCWLIRPHGIFKEPTSFVIEDAAGNLLNASIAADGQWRFPYNKNVPQKFIDCITTFEDKRFFNHSGVDIVAITRSSLANIRHSQTTQGASTITMQVARLACKNQKRNVWNKLKETTLALRFEIAYSKKEIFTSPRIGVDYAGADALLPYRFYIKGNPFISGKPK